MMCIITKPILCQKITNLLKFFNTDIASSYYNKQLKTIQSANNV